MSKEIGTDYAALFSHIPDKKATEAKMFGFDLFARALMSADKKNTGNCCSSKPARKEVLDFIKSIMPDGFIEFKRECCKKEAEQALSKKAAQGGL